MANSDNWNQEQYYNLRTRSVLKSSYRKDGEDKYGPDLIRGGDANGCNHSGAGCWLMKLTKAALIIVAAAVLYLVIIRKTPYCEKDAAAQGKGPTSHCDYEKAGFTLFQSCKPCPKNAFCHGTTMVSAHQLKDETAEVFEGVISVPKTLRTHVQRLLGRAFRNSAF
jgi:hypothetical protein